MEMENDRVTRLNKIYTKYFTKAIEEIKLEQIYSKEDIENINYRGWSTFIKYMKSPDEITKNLIMDFKNELLEITTGIPTRKWYHNIGDFIYYKSLWAGSTFGSYYLYNMYNSLKETLKKTAIESKILVNSIVKSIAFLQNHFSKNLLNHLNFYIFFVFQFYYRHIPGLHYFFYHRNLFANQINH